MRGVFGRVWFGVWLGCFTAAAAQLPPEILMDKYLRQAEQLVREKDYPGARAAMEKLVALQQEHALETDPEDHFRYAQVWSSLGVPERAIESLVRYLELRGRDAEHYEEALDLMNQAEAEKARVEAETELPATQAGQASPAPKPAESSRSAGARRQEVSSTGPGGQGIGADYSKCAELFNNPLETGGDFHIIRSGPFVPDRLRFIPFDLQKDGSIEVHEDLVVSRETRKIDGGTETTIHYASPPLDMLESLDSGKRIRAMVNAHRAGLSGDGDTKPKPAKVVIKRDEDGNISEINEELPDNKNDISTLYTSLLENRTTFETKNGQCVPIRLSMVVRSTTGYPAENVTHFTPLCRDFIELFEENPQLTYAISKQINDEVVEAMRLPAQNLVSHYSFEEFPPKEFTRKFIGDEWHPKSPRTSILLRMILAYHAGTKLPLFEQIRLGIFPVVHAYATVADCDRVGLGPFIRDDSLWAGDADRKATSGEKHGSPMVGQESAGKASAPVGGSEKDGGSVSAGEAVGSSGTSASLDAPSGNTGATSGGGPCQVPGYPNPPGGVANLGFSWCPASVSLQVRSFALQAAGAECAIATGSSSTPERIEARRREIRAACDRLAALGQGNCQCPPGLR